MGTDAIDGGGAGMDGGGIGLSDECDPERCSRRRARRDRRAETLK
jgi:hypothetical protein